MVGRILSHLTQPATPAQRAPGLTAQASWYLAAKVIGFGFTFLLPLLLTRMLNLKEFGLYKQAFQVITTALTLLPLGFSMNLFYYLPRIPERGPQVVWNTFLYNSVIGAASGLAVVIWPGILTAILGSADLVQYAPQIGLVLFLGMSSSFFEVIATANQEVRYSAAFVVLAQFTKSVALILATVLSPSVGSLLYASMIQAVVQLALLFWYMHIRFPGFLRAFDWPLLKEQFSYSAPLAVGGLMYTIRTDYHNYSVSRWFGPEAFAIYSMGCMQLPLIGMLRESLAAVLIPRFSQLEREGRHREAGDLTLRAMRKLALAYWALLALLLAVGYDLLVTMFTDKFRESWPIYQINLLLLVTAVMANDPVLRAYSQHRYYILRLRTLLLVGLVAALELGLLRFGMTIAIIVVVVNMSVERFLITYKVSKVLGMTADDFRPHIRSLAKIAASSAIAGVAAAIACNAIAVTLPQVRLVAGTAAFAIAYGVCLWAFRVLMPDETGMLRAQLARVRSALLPVLT